MASETERSGDVRVTEVERTTLQRLADGDRIVFSQDGDVAWFTNGDRAHLGDEVMTLRDKGFLLRKCDDEENYRGMSEYDTISEAGRAALTATQQPPATHKAEDEAVDPGAPDELWLGCGDDEGEHRVWFDPDEGGTKYVRADLAAETVERLTRERDEARANEDDGLAWDALKGCQALLKAATTRADRAEAALAEAEKERDALREALTPSGDTKAEYIGEFSFPHNQWNAAGDDTETVQVTVPWTTTKEIMAAILSRATIRDTREAGNVS